MTKYCQSCLYYSPECAEPFQGKCPYFYPLNDRERDLPAFLVRKEYEEAWREYIEETKITEWSDLL